MNLSSLGARFTVLSMLLFATMDAISKWLVRDYPISETLWARYFIFSLFALGMCRKSGIPRMARTARPWMQAALALLTLLEGAVFVLAFRYLPLADTYAVSAASPLMVVAMSVPLLGERIGVHRFLSLLTGFAGVMLIIRPGFADISWPLMLPLGGACLWALYQIVARFLARGDRPETTMLWSALTGLMVISVIAPWRFRWPDAQGWVLLGAVGVLSSLAYYCLIKALDYADASAVQPYGYTLLVWGAVLGWLVFGDIPDAWTITGAGIVVLSGIYAWTWDRKGH